jgi:putative nucleotidyltransferase with HDIG domain
VPCPLSRDDALALLAAHIKTDYTIRHSLATEAVLRGLARRLGHDEDLWGLTGLLHDLDLEDVGGDPDRHARETASLLAGLGCPAAMTDAILAHNGDHLGIPCRAPLDFALCAGESVTGLVFAMAMVLPSKSVADVKAKSVQKRLREPRFAANVSRERIGQHRGLGLDEDAFFAVAVDAMQGAGV